MARPPVLKIGDAVWIVPGVPPPLRAKSSDGSPPAPTPDVLTPTGGAPDLVAQATRRVLTQFKNSPKLNALITFCCQQFQVVANALMVIPTLDDPAIAGGVNLDVTGDLVGQARLLPNGVKVNDTVYRLLIAVRILRNSSSGTAPQIIAAAFLLFGVEVRFFDFGGMAVIIAVARQPLDYEVSAVKDLNLLGTPAGVRRLAAWYVTGQFFGWSDTPGGSSWDDPSSFFTAGM